MQNTENIEIERLPITLAQFLKWNGPALTGGQAKEMVRSGMVSLNGSPCLLAGQKLQPGDIISIEQQNFRLVLAD